MALNPTYRIFLNFAKSLPRLSKFDNIEKFHHAAFELELPKALIKGVFLAGHAVAIAVVLRKW